MSKIKGGDLMLFIDGKSIAYATSHTLTISGDTQDTSNKDEGGGNWASSEISRLNWSASSDNLYSVDGEGNNFADLFDAMITREPIDAVFCLKSQMNLNDVPTGGWSTSVPSYSGKVAITSLEVNAPNGEYATFTAQFTGVGELKKNSNQ